MNALGGELFREVDYVRRNERWIVKKKHSAKYTNSYHTRVPVSRLKVT